MPGPGDVASLLHDAVEAMLDGYKVDWLRDVNGKLVGFQIRLLDDGDHEPGTILMSMRTEEGV